jgi:hypothetical protein
MLIITDYFISIKLFELNGHFCKITCFFLPVNKPSHCGFFEKYLHCVWKDPEWLERVGDLWAMPMSLDEEQLPTFLAVLQLNKIDNHNSLCLSLLPKGAKLSEQPLHLYLWPKLRISTLFSRDPKGLGTNPLHQPQPLENGDYGNCRIKPHRPEISSLQDISVSKKAGAWGLCPCINCYSGIMSEKTVFFFILISLHW